MRTSPLLLISTVLFACNPAERDAASEHTPANNSGAADQADKQTAKQADADALETPEPPSTDDKPSTANAPKPRPDELAKLRTRLSALLNEGRALTKKGDHAGGIAKYREALEIDASEVTVLGELGWAAFLSGDLELAHRTTAQALKFQRDGKRRGMLLYNLGRIEEARENLPDAIEHYRASLAARPGNEAVQARLDKLVETQNAMANMGSAGGELEGPERIEANASLALLASDLSDLAAACKVIEEQRCEDFTLDVDDPCACDPKLLATPGVDDSWGLLQLGGDSSGQAAWFPAVKTDRGWTVFAEVLYTYNPGAFGIYEEAQLGASTVEPLLAKGTQLVLRLSKSRLDRDMGLNEIETEDYEALVVCARHETGASCTRPLITTYSYRREVEFEGEDAELLGEEIEHEGLPFERGFTARVELADGKLSAEWTQVTGGFAVENDGELWSAIGRVVPAGEHRLGALLGLSD
ncbi:MAG: tetratricopeptide repeat protein [Enhygromyxa sp.]